MYALPGIVGLMIVIYARPHEWTRDLAQFPFVYVFLGLTFVGIVADIASRRTRFIIGPTLGLCTAFLLWCAITLALQDPSIVVKKITPLLVSYIVFVLIAHGVQTTRAFLATILTIFALAIFVAYVGADQGMSEWGCLVVDPSNPNGRLYADGRTCPVSDDVPPDQAAAICYIGGKGVQYRCEKVGMLMTSSISGGRVRYLGVLTDPNELALATALAIPFAFAFFELRRTTVRLAVLIGSLGLIALEIVFTKSRGGQLVFAIVLGAYFVRKYGVKRGVTVAGIMAVPLVILGGRSDEGSDQSTIDRLTAAAAGIKMLLSGPIFGAGFSQFTQHHPLTAHNAYILSAAELGIPGLWMFVSMIFLSTKITLAVLRFEYDPGDREAETMKSLAMAMLAAFCGMAVGVFFLSWTYHFVVWIHLGLAGAFYSVLKRKYPHFQVKGTPKEYLLLITFFLCLLTALTVHIKRKGCW